ncbi:MAG: nucleotidyltransferase domain-containing protein [bacterium]
MENLPSIIKIIKQHYPDIQAIYIFGSYGTEYETTESDVDIALLLPPHIYKTLKKVPISDCRYELEDVLERTVDLINLRLVSTVFQNEIIASGKKIYCADTSAIDDFEALTLSYYQKLNEEIKFILQDIKECGRILSI